LSRSYGVRGQYGDEPHPKVENVPHFLSGDLTRLLQIPEQRRHLPSGRIYRRGAVFRQYPHQISGDSPSSDVGQPVESVQDRNDAVVIAAMDRQQSVRDRLAGALEYILDP
jgi:hypothetical protein